MPRAIAHDGITWAREGSTQLVVLAVLLAKGWGSTSWILPFILFLGPKYCLFRALHNWTKTPSFLGVVSIVAERNSMCSGVNWEAPQPTSIKTLFCDKRTRFSCILKWVFGTAHPFRRPLKQEVRFKKLFPNLPLKATSPTPPSRCNRQGAAQTQRPGLSQQPTGHCPHLSCPSWF